MLKQHIEQKVDNFFDQNRPRFLSWINLVLFYASLLGLVFFLYEVGFSHTTGYTTLTKIFFRFYLVLLFVLLSLRLLVMRKLGISRSWLYIEYLLILLVIINMLQAVFNWQVFRSYTLVGQVIEHNLFTIGVILYVFLTELSKRALNLYHLRFNPALLFVVSFLVLIFIGAGLLLLPRATVGGITLLDALFTAASAVCVTGLVVVDTASYFTPFGKTIIIILIQLGGLGIMTFTSFLAMVFKSESSFQNQLFLKEMVNEEKMGNTMRTVANIVGITFLVEGVGAILIFASLNNQNFDGLGEQLAFSVFHSISAYCNAGFVNLPDGFHNITVRYNYFLHSVLMVLIVIGGIGFPIMFNLYKQARVVGKNRLQQLKYNQDYVHSSRVINLNTKLILITTAALLIAGFIAFFITEYNNTLREHSLAGKIVTSMFGSVTPRSGGLNTIDMSNLTLPMVLVYLLLMWIGASPGSCGGGIKTSTFALGVLNTYNIAQGKDRVEAFGREIPSKSVQQAFAVMLLSFLMIGLSTISVVFFNPDLNLISVAFECFSAFTTTGLSLGATPDLTAGSKTVIIITMFLGRVGIFTLIASMMTKVNTYFYRYPSESIIIT